MSSAVANSRAAADWASKRKAALERAARIKAEREALRATEKQENEQQPESSSTVQHGRRTLGTLAPAGADDDYGLQRSFSAAAGGQQQMERRLEQRFDREETRKGRRLLGRRTDRWGVAECMTCRT